MGFRRCFLEARFSSSSSGVGERPSPVFPASGPLQQGSFHLAGWRLWQLIGIAMTPADAPWQCWQKPSAFCIHRNWFLASMTIWQRMAERKETNSCVKIDTARTKLARLPYLGLAAILISLELWRANPGDSGDLLDEAPPSLLAYAACRRRLCCHLLVRHMEDASHKVTSKHPRRSWPGACRRMSATLHPGHLLHCCMRSTHGL
jgi:hypothetical protein